MIRRRFLALAFTAALVLAAPLVSPATPQISTAAKNAALAAITAKIDTGGAGSLLFYTGTQPAGPDTAISTQTLLVTLTYSATSYGTPSSGTTTANSITSGTAGNSGTATWCRSVSGGGTAVLDLSVGTSGQDVNLATTTITSGNTVSITSLTITHP